MPRTGVEARQRLRDAALLLYAEHGYEGTTTAAIAASAGVNHRTFFRHFADKREVLFGGEDEARAALARSVRSAPAALAPIDVLLLAFSETARALQESKESAVARLRIIATSPALRERDLAKGALLTATIRESLEGRGVSRESADLLAAMGWAAYLQAVAQWSEDESRALETHIRNAFANLYDAAASLIKANETNTR